VTLTDGWDGRLYAANTAHHRRHDDVVLSTLAVPRDGRVLDLGCGVGDLTARLAGLVPDGEVLGVDAAVDMVDTARAAVREPNVRFATVRAQDLDAVVGENAFDAVVSVAVLHWIPAAEHPRVLAQVARALRPGGVLRAQFGGVGQVEDLCAVLDAESRALGGGSSPWYFPDADEYAELLATAGFAVEPGGWVRLLRQRREFPDESAFTGWLRSQVLIAYDSVLPEEAVPLFRCRAEERALRELRRADGSFDQGFVRLDLRAVLPIAL
jgi:trans-aconitate 2-methyltransferase